MQDNNTQPQIVTKTIARAIEMLTASGAKFKVISPNGDEFGELEVTKPTERKKKVFKHKHGALRDIYLPHMQALQPNEVATITVREAGVTLEDVRGSACAWATKHWGSGAYTSGIDKTFNNVEILRIK
jgi:hypothetical protein